MKALRSTASAHTPAPWHIYNDGCRLDYEILTYPNPAFQEYAHAKRICTVHHFRLIDDPHYERLQANVRLIAAAPSLLEACVRLLECPDLNVDDLNIISREAIENAQKAIALAA